MSAQEHLDNANQMRMTLENYLKQTYTELCKANSFQGGYKANRYSDDDYNLMAMQILGDAGKTTDSYPVW